MKALAAVSLVAVCASLAAGQSLFTMPPQPAPAGVEARPVDNAASLYGTSMFAVQPPKPRTYKMHELVTIVVDESVRQNADQETKADKQYNIAANLNAAIDPWQLLELRLAQSNINNLKLIDADAKQKFDGKGTYTRNDSLQMKIEAEIIDVKPNGVLVLEAKKVVDKNGEKTSTILSGSCRQGDITANNSVFSSQLANLTLITKAEGQVNDAGKKGLIPRVLETIFNF